MTHIIDSFTGGIANKLDPAFLRPNQAVDLVNVDLRTGLIESSKIPEILTSTVQSPLLFDTRGAEPVIIQSDSNTMTKQLHDRIYSTTINASSPLQVTYNGVTHNVPLDMLNTEIEHTLVYNDLLTSITSDSTQNTLELALTRVNTVTGYESSPRYISIEPELRELELYSNMVIGFDPTENNRTMPIQFVDTDPNTPVTISRDYITSAIANGTLVYAGVQTLEPGYLDLLGDSSNYGQAYDDGNFFKDFIYSFKLSGDVPVGLNLNRDETFAGALAYIRTKSAYSNHNDVFMLICLVGIRVFDLNQADYTRMLEYLHDKGIMTDLLDVYKYKYKQGIKSVVLHNITPIPSNEKVRVYRLGTLGIKVANTKYQLHGEYAVPADGRIVLNDTDTTLDSLCNTLNQIHNLNTNMFAVSSTNLWAADGNVVRYTAPGSLDIFETLAFISLPTKITGLHYINNRLIVFCADNSIHSITGTNRSDIVLRRIADDVDCVDARSITVVTQTLVWLSSRGLAVTNGGIVQLVDRDTIKSSTYNYVDGSIVSSTSVNDEYYLLVDDYIYIYDFRLKRLTKYDAYGAKKLFLYRGNVYYHDDSTMYGKLFNGDYAEFSYTSGSIVRRSYTTPKEFQWFRLAYSGDINLTIVVDGTDITTVNLPVSSSLTHEQIQIKEGVVGYACQLRIAGTGKIYSANILYNTRSEL
jgi:hypothetical protein